MTTTRPIDDLTNLGTGRVDFIADHGLWTEEQANKAREVLREVDARSLDSIRVSYADPHGHARSKTLTPQAFASAMRNGIGASPGPLYFDTGVGIVFYPFQPGGGVDVTELTGAASFLLVPDPNTFRVLPWAERTGWILADEYFRSGRPVPFSARHLLRDLLAALADRGMRYVVGLEVEWFLTRLVDPALSVESIGGFGAPGRAPIVAPVDLGYQLNLELLNDQHEHVLGPLSRALVSLGFPLRTIEHETDPCQIEFTFDPLPGLDGPDAMVLLRTAVKQICARHGHHATFMSSPGLAGFGASGWHLHQSLFELETGHNAFTGSDDGSLLSELGTHFAGGLLQHASAAAIFAVPTVNGYRRLDERFALSPDHVTWSADNRGAFIRVVGGGDDPSSHFENRLGEPCANPYLYAASQLIAGLDGVDNKTDPGPMSDNPHAPELPPLPRTLGQAIDGLRASELFRRTAGDVFVDYYLALKDKEWGRFQEFLAAGEHDPTVVTEWEQREYFRVY